MQRIFPKNPYAPINPPNFNIIVLPYILDKYPDDNSATISPKKEKIEFWKKFPFIFSKLKIIP